MVTAMYPPAPYLGYSMIKDLTLIKYQSHQNSHFEFSEGVNVIVGVSDSGKSSVLRGIKLVLQNRPLGLSFHSNFAKKEEPTEVYITVQNGKSTKRVGRIRNEDRNEYIVEGFEEPFVAFGTEVPDEVSKVLNISDINCQFQMDSPFLFSESPGAVARYLNSVVNLDKIDIALQNITSKKRQNESEIKFNQGRLSELEKNIKLFPDLEHIGNKLSEFETLQESLESYEYTKELLLGLITSVEEFESKIGVVQKVSKLSYKVKTLEQIVSEKQNLESLYDKLFKLTKEIGTTDSRIAETQRLIQKYPDIIKLESIAEELDQFQYTLDILNKMVIDIDKYETKIVSLRNFIKKESSRLKTLMGDSCPLCGASLGD